MNRTEKAQTLESLKAKFVKANAAFVTEYRGLSVEKLHSLRSKVRGSQGELKILNNRVARLAAKGTAFESLADKFKGPIALAFSYGDPAAIAKAVTGELSEESPLKLNAGALGGKVISEKEVTALSKMPSREVMLAKLAGTLQAPISNFARLLAAVPRDMAGVLVAVKDLKEKQK